jgi:glycosyltransferase involved in cell wall biosynthesis
MILSILICTLEERYDQFTKLVDFLRIQPGFNTEFHVHAYFDNRENTTGFKRNVLIKEALGDYVAFIDDDDEVTDDYIPSILEACKQGPDVVGFRGWMTTNGKKRESWKISKDLPYITISHPWNGGVQLHLRFNNHLSPVKRSIAVQIGFKDVTYGEDYDYAVRLKESGLVKTEVFINKELYHYRFKSKK